MYIPPRNFCFPEPLPVKLQPSKHILTIFSSLCMRQFMIVVIAANYHHESRIHIFWYGQRAERGQPPSQMGIRVLTQHWSHVMFSSGCFQCWLKPLHETYLQIQGWTGQMRLFLLYKCVFLSCTNVYFSLVQMCIFLLYKCPSKIMFKWTVCTYSEVILNKAWYVDEIIDARGLIKINM